MPNAVASQTASIPVLAVVLIAVSAFLLTTQVLVSASAAGGIDAGRGAALVATWAPTGVVLSVLFAVATRHRVLTMAFGGVAVVATVAFPVLSAGDVWAPVAVTASLALAAVAAVLGAVAPADGTGPLRIIAFTVAAAAVVLFYGLSILTPVIALDGSPSSIMGVLGTTPIAVLATAAAAALCFAPRHRAVAGWLVVGVGVALMILPVTSLASGQPPMLASFVVVALRAALLAAAGLLIVRAARS